MTTHERFLHVANGTCTTDIIHQAGIPGRSSIWADPLHEGPVPGNVTDDELVRLRANYFARCADDSVEAMIAEVKGWRRAIEDVTGYEEIVLWYEHDLFDQLNLLQVLTRILRTVAKSRLVTLICIGSFPGRPRFKGLGELTPDELASLFDTRKAVSDAQYALATAAWDAFRAPDPREIETLLKSDTSALPFLASALERYLEEFPSAAQGLSRTEHRLMELAAQGPIDLWAVFPQMHDDETAFYIADLSFWNVVQGLTSAIPPLMAAEVSAVPGQLPHGTVSLTDTGRAVLEGQVDRVRACGIDRWLGGVHLTGSGVVWRWDTAADRIVNA